MRFLLDECLSHTYVADFVARGYPDVYHPIHVGWREARDDQLLQRAVAENRVLITPNARDFRRLISTAPIHPGIVVIEVLDRDAMLDLIFAAIAHAQAQPDPELYMINRVIELSRDQGLQTYLLPEV